MTRKWGKFMDVNRRHHWVRMDQICVVQPADFMETGLPTTITTESGTVLQAYGCNGFALMRDLTAIDKRAALTDYTGAVK